MSFCGYLSLFNLESWGGGGSFPIKQLVNSNKFNTAGLQTANFINKFIH